MDKLINKQYKLYKYFSRYSPFPYYYNIEDNKYIYGITSHIDPNTTYTLYKTEKNDTLDYIALEAYNNPTFFWAIADFNKISDPYEKLEANMELKIPSLSDIKFIER